METFKVAHIREQGQDMVIVFVSSAFGSKSKQEQQAASEHLTRCANRAGLAGTAVPVWDDGFGRMKFFAPTPWHPFFRSLSLEVVAASVNKTLTCG